MTCRRDASRIEIESLAFRGAGRSGRHIAGRRRGHRERSWLVAGSDLHEGMHRCPVNRDSESGSKRLSDLGVRPPALPERANQLGVGLKLAGRLFGQPRGLPAERARLRHRKTRSRAFWPHRLTAVGDSAGHHGWRASAGVGCSSHAVVQYSIRGTTNVT